MLESLEKAVGKYNDENGRISAKISIEEDSSFCIAIITPLMARILETSLASDICFMDSTGGLDRFGCRVFLMFCLSCAGGLPIGK